MKKSSALLLVVLFIAIFGAVTVTATRAGLLNGIFTNNTIDAMIAEEASQAGLEVGLLDYKTSGSAKTLCVDLETGVVTPITTGECDGAATTRYAKVEIAPADNNPSLIKITSTGHYGYVVKQHVLTQVAEAWNP